MTIFHRFSLLFLSTFALLLFFLQSSYGQAREVCISQGGRFSPFRNEGKTPTKTGKGSKDLTLCRIFRKRTCCDISQTYPALLSIRKLASSGEASQECLQLWELLECAICDPRVGVQRGPPLICTSFCDRVYDACSSAYLSMDARAQTLGPCGVGDFVCGRTSEWVSNGTQLCRAMGFSVTSVGDSEETCYAGKDSFDKIANSWKSANSENLPGENGNEIIESFTQWIAEIAFSERISWAVGGMVLTAGLLFASKRKTQHQRQKQAAIQRAVRKVGTRVNSTSPVSQGNRQGIR